MVKDLKRGECQTGYSIVKRFFCPLWADLGLILPVFLSWLWDSALYDCINLHG